MSKSKKTQAKEQTPAASAPTPEAPPAKLSRKTYEKELDKLHV